MIGWASPKATHYLKRQHVPECCPKCGVKYARVTRSRDHRHDVIRRRYQKWNLDALFAFHYGSWRRVQRRHPLWRMKMWYGTCGRCIFEEALRGPSFLDKIKKTSDFKGASIRIPFGR